MFPAANRQLQAADLRDNTLDSEHGQGKEPPRGVSIGFKVQKYGRNAAPCGALTASAAHDIIGNDICN